MSDCGYEFECSRAELLGLPRPSREEFLARKPEEFEAEPEVAEQNDIIVDQIENIDLQGEGINRATGGLDELNNILSITQKKINRFKTVCGSFTNLLKLKVGGKGEGEGDMGSVDSVETDPAQEVENGSVTEGGGSRGHAQIKSSGNKDVTAQVGCQIDKLDSMLMKAEQAELSLSSQNKQMRKFLNK